MDKFGDAATAIIAGASGLVGNELLRLLLSKPSVSKVYALVRSQLSQTDDKLTQIQHEDLMITNWQEGDTAPDIGFICLGTTIKQAGSKEALAKVDFELVCRVAQEMKLIGVKRIAVVSSFGADPKSLSHYLRCKGKAEKTILDMGFERVVFVRPGPLAGERKQKRTDEVIIGKLLNVLNPLLIGYLANFRPIQAKDVASAMLYATLQPKHIPSDSYMTFTTPEMIKLLNSF
ncbi:NAD(P)H-binding protein [Vibrio hannami]|uniref:NAD-dependent epimerase/dehydratase family protein n=1 Tax=Vibrio hannami TaxID=2717094 RepID=UPI00240F7392|nr:NAD(P)H-binding protein [Vibrio hannami]MDG3088023.1 NAD(P)H-binding protein [Vibrio hannami]